MNIPTQNLMTAAAAAFRAADFHVRFCDTCRIDMRLPEMCAVGQRLSLDAATSMETDPAPEIEPFPPTAAAGFEQGVRDQVRAELLYFADRMEAGRPELADVHRDAYYVREAARVAQRGLGRSLYKGCLDQATTRHMDEISRLRGQLDDEIVRRVAAEEWADLLAHRIAPAAVIGRRNVDGATPWGDAAELATPAAEVAELRATLAAYQAGEVAPTECGDSWTAEREAQIRSLVVSLADGDADGTRTPRPERVETAAAIEAATLLQLRVDFLERRVRDLQREAETSAPERLPALPAEFETGAAPAAIEAAIRKARMNRTRWTNRLIILEALLQKRFEEIEAGTWPPKTAEETVPVVAETAPVADPRLCPQNRTGAFLHLSDPVVLGDHFHKAGDADMVRCVFCGAAPHWVGNDPQPPVAVPVYAGNAQSVNQVVKHLLDPDDAARTLCPGKYIATPPLSPRDAGRRPLCGGCRRAVTGLQD
ncbi:hypothetical protein [Streptomyces sp. NPDC047070]|uniref:hypothetical protein n=1 Tax=Streptomyces sp. NPDC047070 TaxID=3154923 RepID=UPI003455431A